MKMAELFPLKVYPFTLICCEQSHRVIFLSAWLYIEKISWNFLAFFLKWKDTLPGEPTLVIFIAASLLIRVNSKRKEFAPSEV